MLDAWCLMLDACLMVHAACLKAHGSWLMAKKGARPRSGPGPRASFLAWAMSHEPWAMSHEPSSMHQASSIKHQASSIKHQASSICSVTNQHTTEVEALLTRDIVFLSVRVFSKFWDFYNVRLPIWGNSIWKQTGFKISKKIIKRCFGEILDKTDGFESHF